MTEAQAMTDNYEHARGNAKGWFEELREVYKEYAALHEADAPFAEIEALQERVQEMPLSVEVRSPWYVPGAKAEDTKPAEYNILLTTGGPALRVWGELDNYGQPDSAQLQMQDWGLPWREVWPCELAEMDEARATLMWFASQFYFGE